MAADDIDVLVRAVEGGAFDDFLQEQPGARGRSRASVRALAEGRVRMNLDIFGYPSIPKSAKAVLRRIAKHAAAFLDHDCDALSEHRLEAGDKNDWMKLLRALELRAWAMR